ncbi:hypothetical protein B0H13DRAFT_2365842 [Mycena leptocephala]|nr:hypothetical protein B0H13DRAFT_2365842 [Mycena leptocephala]
MNNLCRDLVIYDPTLELFKALVLKAPTRKPANVGLTSTISSTSLANVPQVIVYDIACQYRPHMCAYRAETDWANCAP